MNKLFSTIRICYTIFMARTFGEYVHSVWDRNVNYHLYKYKGDAWMIPYSPYEENE